MSSARRVAPDGFPRHADMYHEKCHSLHGGGTLSAMNSYPERAESKQLPSYTQVQWRHPELLPTVQSSLSIRCATPFSAQPDARLPCLPWTAKAHTVLCTQASLCIHLGCLSFNHKNKQGCVFSIKCPSYALWDHRCTSPVRIGLDAFRSRGAGSAKG